MLRNTFITCGAIASLLLVAGVDAAVVLPADTADGHVSRGVSSGDGSGTPGSLTSTTAQAGRSGTNYFSFVVPFQLPDFGAVASPFASASFNLTIQQTNDFDGFNTGRGYDLYALPRRSSAAIDAADFFVGGTDTTDATLIQNNLVNSSNTARFASNVAKTTSTSANANLLNFLNAQYAGGAGAGDFIFIRLNADGVITNEFGRMSIYTQETSNAAQRPAITFTVIPEPSSLAVIAAGFALVGMRRRPSLGIAE